MLHESDTVELKSSLRWNYETAKADPAMERQVVKAVAGFLNSYQGGTLVIGLNDRNEPLGLEPDYSTLRTRADRDGFEQALEQTLANAFGDGCCAKWIKVRFCSIQGKDVSTVAVSPATAPIYPREEGKEEDTLYVRLGNTTRPLNPKEAVAYARDRWSGITLRRPYFREPIMQPA